MKTRFHFHKVSPRKFDFILFGLVMGISLFGLLMIYNSSSVIAFNLFADKFKFIKDQLVWFTLGITALFVFYWTDYHKLYNLALPLLISALVLLILVFVPGIGAGALGANRWVDFKF